MRRYFKSEDFLAKKAEIQSVVAEHNHVKGNVSEIRDSAKFELGTSSTGSQSHLAETTNTSLHNYKRDRRVSDFSSSNVHNCSLQLVRNAKADPLKYLMKYFEFKPNENALSDVEELGEHFWPRRSNLLPSKPRKGHNRVPQPTVVHSSVVQR